jgi:TRAP transporter TAXI family solute receptor
MSNRLARLAVAAVLVGSGAVACGGEEPLGTDRLVVATGGTGGVYFAIGTALAAAAHDRWPTLDARVLTTGGSVENLRLVADGKADLGFATVDTAALAVDGHAPFDYVLPIAALAGLYEDYLQVVVRADSDIRQVAQLRGRRVSTGSPGSGTEVVAERMLDAVHLDPNRDVTRSRLSAADSAEALFAGRVDAFFFSGGLPTPAVANLAERLPVRLLSARDEATVLQERFGEFYVPRSIPVGAYHLDAEVETLGIANVLVARRDVSNRLAYRLTSLLFTAKPRLVAAHEQARRLDPRSGLATFPIPLHPGAEQYYRKAKPMAAGRPPGSGALQGERVEEPAATAGRRAQRDGLPTLVEDHQLLRRYRPP